MPLTPPIAPRAPMSRVLGGRLSHSSRRSRVRHHFLGSLERLEARQLLAADYLYSLIPRDGLPEAAMGLGNSLAANALYHVAGQVFGAHAPDSSGFAGEVQIHDAQTGNLLRTIANPDPEQLYAFGHSVAISGNLLVVGAIGRGEPVVSDDDPQPEGPFSDLSGRAYLYNASTGELLHTFNSGLTPGDPYPLVRDHFGASVAIEGNYVIVSAPGAYIDINEIAGEFPGFEDPGRVYVFSAMSGDLLHVIDNPVPAAGEGFGLNVSISDGNLLIASPFDDNDGEVSGAAYLFNVSTGDLLHTFENPDADIEAFFGGFAVISGNTVVLGGQISIGDDIFEKSYVQKSYIYNATTGDLTRTITASMATEPGDPTLYSIASAFSGNLLILSSVPVSQPLEPGNPIAWIHDVTTGELVDTVIPPSHATFSLYTNFRLFNDRLLVSNSTDGLWPDDEYPEAEVWVFSIETGNTDPPDSNSPTDIALAGNMVAEGSANGTFVGTLSATDADPGETFTFTLTNSAGGRFAIDGNQLVVANGNALNHEANPTLNITVLVADSDGNTYSETFLIQVTDVNEPITDLFLLDHRVVEHSPNGAIVGAIDNPAPTAFDAFGKMVVSGNRILVSSFHAPETYILDALTFEVLHTLVNPNPAASASGFTLALSESYAVVGNRSDASGQGAVHIYDVQTGTLLKTLTGTGSSSFFFGNSVAISQNRIAVGSFSGDVLVYEVGTWNLVQTLEPPLSNDTGFGTNIAITQNHILVSQSSIQAGYVHVFNAVTGAFLFTINNPTPAQSDSFGESIRVVGNSLLISAPRDDTAGEDAGAVYLFNATTGSLLHTFLPTGTDTDSANFGSAIDMMPGRIAIGSSGNSGVDLYESSTYNLIRKLPDIHFGEEYFGVYLAFIGDRLLVADRATRGANESGEIQVFDATTGDLMPGFRVVDGDQQDTYTYTLLDDAGGRFAIDGNQLVVANSSAIDHDTASSHTIIVQVTDGASHSFTKSLTIDVIAVITPPTDISLSGSTVTEATVRYLHNLDPGRRFGAAVAILGDRMMVAETQLSPQTLLGRVNVIQVATGAHLATLVHPAPVAGLTFLDGAFGSSVAITDSVAVVAASYDPVGSLAGAGRVFVFSPTTGALLHTLQSPSPASLGRFGLAITASGNRIAVSEVIQGVANSVGTVYLFDATTGSLLETIFNPSPDPGDRFGTSIQLRGDRLLIGASGDNSNGLPSGRAYLYHLDSVTSAATLIHGFSSPSANSVGEFGTAVALTDNLVAISGDNDTVAGVLNAGAVHLFDATTGLHVRTIANPSPVMNDRFGTTLTIMGNHIIVGKSYFVNNTSGQVHIFDITSGSLVAILDNPSPANEDYHGAAHAADGGHIIIPAMGDDTDGTNFGLVYLHHSPFGQLIGTLSATDADPGETFTYQLLNDAGGRFALDGNRLIVANATRIDFETAITHEVTVLVTDSKGGTFVKTFTISVEPRNEPPRDLVISGSSVPENSANGTIVGTLTTIDPDFGETFTYQLLDNAGGRFALIGNQLVVANGALLDFEVASTHRVTVRATDAGGLSTTEVRFITVNDLSDTFDFGDLPATYGTTLATNGARHVVGAGPWLGSVVTAETDGLASANANADAGDDGVVLPFLLIPGLNATFTVTASVTSRLDAFLDFNANGTFEANERVTAAGGRLLAAGVNTVTVAVPSGAVAGSIGARFRVSSVGGLEATGAAANGEVEDYRVTVAGVSPYSATVVPDPEAQGSNMLLVNGTSGPDLITVRQARGALRVRINGVAQPPSPTTVSRIVILGGDGNDRIQVLRTSLPSYVDGGAGNNRYVRARANQGDIVIRAARPIGPNLAAFRAFRADWAQTARGRSLVGGPRIGRFRPTVAPFKSSPVRGF